VDLTITHSEVSQTRTVAMLEFEDIQHILLTRAPALAARYEFLSFHNGAGGRAWVSAIREKIHSAALLLRNAPAALHWWRAAIGILFSSPRRAPRSCTRRGAGN